MRKPNKNINYKKLTIAVLVIGILLRFILATVYHISGDACWQVSNARFIAENKRLPLFEEFGRDEPFWPPPLFHIIAAFVYWIFSSTSDKAGIFAVKMISPIAGSLTLVFSLLIAKRLFNDEIAFYSSFFLAFVPLSLDYGVYSYIDGMLALPIVISVYFALNNKIIYSAIAAGLGFITKYNGAFIAPVLIYIIYKNSKGKKDFIKKAGMIAIVAGLIGSIWFIRNWIYLGNPVWPFLNDIFNGFKAESFASSTIGTIDVSRIFTLTAISQLYLGFFGVPDGSIHSFSFVQMPYFKLVLAIWLIGTLVFFTPFILGLLKKNFKYRMLSFVWIASYILLILLYVLNASWSTIRFMLPAFPAISFIWANGLARIDNEKLKGVLLKAVVLISIGLVFTSVFKIIYARNAWEFYEEDFEWARQNTPKGSLFLSGSQCISFNIARQTISPKVENLGKADYVFVNQQFPLDYRASFSKKMMYEIENSGKLIYKNDSTKGEVYILN